VLNSNVHSKATYYITTTIRVLVGLTLEITTLKEIRAIKVSETVTME
jgi:hypothetical protein